MLSENWDKQRRARTGLPEAASASGEVRGSGGNRQWWVQCGEEKAAREWEWKGGTVTGRLWWWEGFAQ